MCGSADVLNFKYRMSKCFYWCFDQICKIYLKNFNPSWRYKQNLDYISRKWNISTKWNAHGVVFQWHELVFFVFWYISMFYFAPAFSEIFTKHCIKTDKVALRQKCPNTEFLQVRIFLYLDHGDTILNSSNNWWIFIETSTPPQAGGFIVKRYIGISNIAACR